MDGLSDIARHWARQTDKGRGLRLEAHDLNLLNAIGVGELILAKAAEQQRKQCVERSVKSQFISEETTGWSGGQIERTWRSSGMTASQDGIEALARVQRRLKKAPASSTIYS